MEGKGLAGPLAATGLFPVAARQMFRVGEETGTLDQQLETAAKYYSRDLDEKVKRFTSAVRAGGHHLHGRRRRLRRGRPRLGDVRHLQPGEDLTCRRGRRQAPSDEGGLGRAATAARTSSRRAARRGLHADRAARRDHHPARRDRRASPRGSSRSSRCRAASRRACRTPATPRSSRRTTSRTSRAAARSPRIRCATQCGAGTQLLGLEWNYDADTATYQSVVTYARVKDHPIFLLRRQYCASGASATTDLATTISYGHLGHPGAARRSRRRSTDTLAARDGSRCRAVHLGHLQRLSSRRASTTSRSRRSPPRRPAEQRGVADREPRRTPSAASRRRRAAPSTTGPTRRSCASSTSPRTTRPPPRRRRARRWSRRSPAATR